MKNTKEKPSGRFGRMWMLICLAIPATWLAYAKMKVYTRLEMTLIAMTTRQLPIQI